MQLSRRQLLVLSGAALGAGWFPNMGYSQESTTLPIPPLLESFRGQPVFLTLQSCHWAFLTDRRVATWGINGRYLGPTVRVRKGDNLKLICSNHLTEAVALTVSGLLVPGSIVGNARRLIQPGKSWSPVLPIQQSACTGWYRSVTPHKMAKQIYQGLAGLWIIEDDESDKLNLPNRYGVDDFPVILQDKAFNTAGEPEYGGDYPEGFFGKKIVTNGVESPYIQVPKSWVRLRLVNASSARYYQLSLSNHRDFKLIASDQGLLPSPLDIKVLPLAPGERREVLIDMTRDNDVKVQLYTGDGFWERLKNTVSATEQPVTKDVLILLANGNISLDASILATELAVQPDLPTPAVAVRRLVLDEQTATINGVAWNLNRIDFRCRLNTVERWIISTRIPQAFYIQGVAFLVDKIEGMVPEPEFSGWKDTVWIEQEVELLVYFNQRSQLDYPFLFFSQNLDRADAGAMGQFVVHS